MPNLQTPAESQNNIKNETNFSQIEKPANFAVLKIRAAGISDMLEQVSTFFLFCEQLSLKPYFKIPSKNLRNEVSSQKIFQLLGFNKAEIIVEKFCENNAILLSDAMYLLSQNKKLPDHYFIFDSKSYVTKINHIFLTQVIGKKIIHPKLSSIVRKGELFKKIEQQKNPNQKKITIHVRRGDVAQIKLSLISDFLSEDKFVVKIAHPMGIFAEESIKENLTAGNFNRYKPIEAYLEKLQKVCNKMDSKYSVSLLSDGMTRLTKQLRIKNKHIFKNPDISHFQLEQALNKELEPLIELSHQCLIGENNGLLLDSIIEGLTSDIIITGSPGLFMHLNLIMKLDIKFVHV